MSKQFFVTGTDTEIGKTTVTSSLVSAVAKMGHTCVGLKPIAAGQDFVDGAWVNDDVLRLSRVCEPAIGIHEICTYQFRTPCAPHIAADLESQVIEKDVVLKHIRSSVRLAEYSFVEGVGGFDIPLNPDWTTADLAADLQFPVILVVGMRLGCINHALLSIESIERRGLQLAGWVGNFVDPNFSFAKENLSTLSDRIKAPIIGTVPYMEEPLQDVDVSDFKLKQLLDC